MTNLPLQENDELKIRQKDSAVVVKASQGKYTFSYKITVPDDFPVQPVQVEEKSNSFPPEMRVYFRANAAEIARKCTQVCVRRVGAVMLLLLTGAVMQLDWRAGAVRIWASKAS